MPFTKITEGKNKGKYRSESGRVYTLKQVRAYHATGGWKRPVRKIPAAIISAVAMAVCILVTGCGSGPEIQQSAPQKTPVTTQAPESHLSQVREDLLVWKASGGASAMKKIIGDMSVIRNPSAMTEKQIAQITTDLNAARTKPMPASADPGEYYGEFLGHLGAMLTAVSNHDPVTALAESEGTLAAVKGLNSEIHQLPEGILSS